MKGLQKSLKKALRESAVIRGIHAFFSAFYDLLLRVFFPSLRHMYPRAVNTTEKSLLLHPKAGVDTGAQEREERSLAFNRMVYNSRGLRFTRALKNRLLATTCQSYGMLAVTYGIITLSYYLLQVFIEILPVRYDLRDFGIALVISVFALLLLFFNIPLYRAMRDSRLFSFVMFEFLGIPRIQQGKEEKGIPIGRSFLYGVLLAVLSVIFSQPPVLISLFALVLFLLVWETPEFSLILTVIFLPLTDFFPYGTLLLCVILCVGFLSYLRKLFFKQRTFRLTPVDLTVLFGGLLFLFAGIFSFGGTPSLLHGLLYTVLLLGYLLSANLFTGEKAFVRMARIVVLMSVLVSAVGIAEYFTGHAVNDWLDTSLFPDIEGRIVSLFGNANILSVYLLLGAGISLSMIPLAKSAGTRILALLSYAVIVFATVLTWSRGAWLSLLFGVLVFVFLYSRRAPVFLSVGLLFCPILFYFIPQTVVDRFLSSLAPIFGTGAIDSSSSYRISVFQGVLSMIRDHLFGGIGTGDAAFSAVYPYYAIAGAEEAVHSHSLYLQFFVEMGILGLVFLLLLFFCLFLDVASHKRLTIRDPKRTLHIGAFVSLFSLLVCGLSDYVFYSPRIYLLFFLVAGMATALGKSGREHLYAHAEDKSTLTAEAAVTVKN